MGRGRPPACIHCGSTNSISKGVRRTKTMGERRLRVCKDCKRKFTPRHQGKQPAVPAAEPVAEPAAAPALDGPQTDH